MHITEQITISRAIDPAKTATFKMETTPRRNKGYRGFKLSVGNIAGTGTITISVAEYTDNGVKLSSWTLGALAAGAGLTVLAVHPALTTAGNYYNDILGAMFNATITLSGGASLQFDCVLDLIP